MLWQHKGAEVYYRQGIHRLPPKPEALQKAVASGTNLATSPEKSEALTSETEPEIPPGDIVGGGAEGINSIVACVASNHPRRTRDRHRLPLDWIDRNQCGRRNLSPDDFKIISGRIYNRRKKQGQRKDLTSPQFEDKSKTSATVAEELGTSKATIERNGQRATLHDAMLDIGDKEAAEAARTLPQKDVTEVKQCGGILNLSPPACFPPVGWLLVAVQLDSGLLL